MHAGEGICLLVFHNNWLGKEHWHVGCCRTCGYYYLRVVVSLDMSLASQVSRLVACSAVGE